MAAIGASPGRRWIKLLESSWGFRSKAVSVEQHSGPGKNAAGAQRPFYAVAKSVLFYILAAYAAAATFPVSGYPVNQGLDPSWHFGLNQFFFSPYKFGRDVIFTYGPLGFVCFPEHIGHNLIIAFGIRLFIWAAVLGALVVGYRRKQFDLVGCLIAAGSLVVAHTALASLDYMLAVAALMLILWQGSEGARPIGATVLLIVLNSLAGLTKTSAYVMVTASLIVYICLVTWKDCKKPTIASAVAAASIILAPLGGFLIYDRSFTDLGLYVVNCGEIIGGYSAAMSLPGLPGGDVWSIVLLLALIVGFGVYSAWRRWLDWAVVGCVCISVAFGVKHAVVRAHGHQMPFFEAAPIFLAIMAAKCRGGKACTWLRSAVWGCVCCVALVAASARMTGKYSGSAPAITALTATFSTVYSQDSRKLPARMRPTTLSGGWLVPLSIAATRSSVGSTMGRKSVQRLSMKSF